MELGMRKRKCYRQEKEQETREIRPETKKFRELIRFEGRSDSHFGYGMSQKLCRTGQTNKETFQWRNVYESIWYIVP